MQLGTPIPVAALNMQVEPGFDGSPYGTWFLGSLARSSPARGFFSSQIFSDQGALTREISRPLVTFRRRQPPGKVD